jgi:hypothetical protein
VRWLSDKNPRVCICPWSAVDGNVKNCWLLVSLRGLYCYNREVDIMSKCLWRYDMWVGFPRLESKKTAISRVYVVFVRSRGEDEKLEDVCCWARRGKTRGCRGMTEGEAVSLSRRRALGQIHCAMRRESSKQVPVQGSSDCPWPPYSCSLQRTS